MEINIREYTKDDWFELITISDDEWADTIRSLSFSLLREYDGEILKTILAFCDEKIAGFIYGFILPNQALIPEFMYIKPECRHNRIAQKLLAELEKQSGCSASMIFYNKSLHDFYQNQGYLVGDNLEVAMKTLMT